MRLPLRRQLEAGNGKVAIRFYAHGRARGFLCSFDRRPFHRCRSPKRYHHVGSGKHVFAVRAIGVSGLRGPVTREVLTVAPVCGPVHWHKPPPARSVAAGGVPARWTICA